MTSIAPLTPDAHILLVDDQEANIALLQAVLQQAGYFNLTSVTDSRDVLSLCQERQPDLVLLDLHMPHLDGFGVMAQLQQALPPDDFLPILVLTADISLETRRRALELGAQDFISKPFDRIEVLLRVRNFLQTRAQYRAQAERQRVLVAQSGDLTIVVGRDKTIKYASPSFERVLGHSPSQLLGVSIDTLVHPDDLVALMDAFTRAEQETGTVAVPDCRVRHAGGEWRNVQGRLVSHLNDPTVDGVIINIRDITDHQILVQTLRDQAGLDQVTGLCNRDQFRDVLAAALLEATSQSASVALALIDLEGVSDAVLSAGLNCADSALREAVARLSPLLRSIDTFARLGDSQLAIILPGKQLASSLWAARKVLGALATPVTVGSITVPLRAAVGVALGPEDGRDADTLMQAATVALAAAGQSAQGFSSYSSAQAQQVAFRSVLIEPLRHVVENNQLVLYYHPQVDVRKGRGHVTGVEALVRWQHPEHGLIQPNQFIGLAEQQGIIDAITFWTMATAFRQCRQWQDIGLSLTMSVNLSIRSLLDPRLPAKVDALLQQAGVLPQTIVLEVTESALMVDKDRTLASLKKIAALGIRISVDDFGTGYSSLEYLRRMPVSEVKIDQSFVREATRVDQDRAIVESVVTLGHRLGLTVVAEGVEDHRTLSLLQHLGCDSVQGFYFTQPLPAQEFKKWLDQSQWGVQQIVR